MWVEIIEIVLTLPFFSFVPPVWPPTNNLDLCLLSADPSFFSLIFLKLKIDF